MPFCPEEIRKDFPMLKKEMNGKKFIYLDTAATSHKPMGVIQEMTDFYSNEYATVHRSIYEFATLASEKYALARRVVQEFIRASSDEEIIFTRGTTQSLNIIARCLGKVVLNEGDEVLISEMEHHSNIVPWQMITEEMKAFLRVVPINDEGDIIIEAFKKSLTPRTKIVSLCHISNAIGTINPIQELIKVAHDNGSIVVIDGAQSVPHMPIDIQELDADFFVFSGHKMYGPTGIGILYGKMKYLEKMLPYEGGGDMVQEVTFAKTEFQRAPLKFEAGTPPIVEVMGLKKAIEYLKIIDRKSALDHEKMLTNVLLSGLQGIEGVKILGSPQKRSGIVSFVIEGIHPLDVGTLLGLKGIAIRTGSQCASPALGHFGYSSVVRVSLGMYNTLKDVEEFLKGIREVKELILPYNLVQ